MIIGSFLEGFFFFILQYDSHQISSVSCWEVSKWVELDVGIQENSKFIFSKVSL